MQTERCEWLDISKGIAIILVVIGHSIQYYLYPSDYGNFLWYRVIYSFHMSFFFLLSGFSSGFSRRRGMTINNLKQKFKRLIIPYLVWGLLYFPANLLYKGWSISLISDIIMNPPRFSLWYLFSLFFIWSIHAGIVSITSKNPRRYILYLIITILLTYLAILLNGKYCSNEISKYFIFYAIGYEICFQRKELFSPPLLINSMFCIVVFIIFYILFDNLSNGASFSSHLLLFIFRFILGVSGSFFLINLSKFICNSKYAIIKKSLQACGRQTLGIYATNSYIIMLFAVVLHGNSRFFVISVVCCIVIAYVISIIISKYKILSKILLGQAAQSS